MSFLPVLRHFNLCVLQFTACSGFSYNLKMCGLTIQIDVKESWHCGLLCCGVILQRITIEGVGRIFYFIIRSNTAFHFSFND